MSTITYQLQPGRALTVTPSAGEVATVTCREDAAESALLRAARTWGPYLLARTFDVRGTATVSEADSTVGAALSGLLIASAGIPADAVQSSASVNPTGDDNALTYTAKAYGSGGNALAITYVDPGAADQSLSVEVVGLSIIVSLATNGGAAITSTAAEVLAAINASVPAAKLVTVAIDATDTGVADDGSGVVTAIASTAFTSGAGTGIGIARPGCLAIDTTNGLVYRNSGSRAAPAWTALGDAA